MSEVGTNLIVHPRTAEVLDLNAAQTDDLLVFHDGFKDLEREMREARSEVDAELIRRADFEGRRSLTFSEFKVDVTPPTEKVWDLERLENALEALVEGNVISQLKAEKCIKHEPKVVWAEVKTLLTDPRLREEIEACFTEEPARRSVRVSRRG